MLIKPNHDISIAEVVKVARLMENVELSSDVMERIQISYERKVQIASTGRPTYGINTGFGIFADQRIEPDEIEKLNRNLVISHAVGIGRPLEQEVVRAAMLIRAVTLAKGFSGVNPQIIQTLIEMLNKGVTPVIPSQGSLGSSGDLCPLSHLALVLSTDERDLDEESGEALIGGQLYSGKKAMEIAGIERVILGPKDGLAINNGATFSAAIASLAINDALYLLDVAEKAGAMSLEALLGCSDAFDPRIHQARNQVGQIHTATALRTLIEQSTLIDSTDRVQDAYSLRCIPQVHGPVRDTVEFVKSIIEREINAVTDNPLIFDSSKALSGGNFHGEPIALTMDYLAIALCELGAISERRTFRLTDQKLSEGLPAMLTQNDAGLNSGLMLPQYAAASLVLENQSLATPDSVRSLPTSANQEDHNSNSMTAARHVREIVENLGQILSIELLTASQAISLRINAGAGKPGLGTARVHEVIRNTVPFHKNDTIWGVEIKKINQLIKENRI